MLKARQQQIALRVALYILHKNGFSAPPKRQVLNFIKFRHLVHFPDEELQKRWEGDHDTIWENDIAWKRKDLFMDGEIDSPERGQWRLTDIGIKRIENSKSKWLDLANSEKREILIQNFDYLTNELFEWMLKIAKGESLSLSNDKNKSPQ